MIFPCGICRNLYLGNPSQEATKRIKSEREVWIVGNSGGIPLLLVLKLIKFVFSNIIYSSCSLTKNSSIILPNYNVGECNEMWLEVIFIVIYQFNIKFLCDRINRKREEVIVGCYYKTSNLIPLITYPFAGRVEQRTSLEESSCHDFILGTFC